MSDLKIMKPNGQKPDELEEQVAQEISNLEMSSAEMKADLQGLYILTAKQVNVGGKKAVILFVPYKLLARFHSIHQRLIRELEKKLK